MKKRQSLVQANLEKFSRTQVKISSLSKIKSADQIQSKEKLKKIEHHVKTDQIKEASLVAQISPVYPWRAKKLSLQGVVTLQFVVTIDGRSKNIKVIKSSGHDVLDAEAIKSLSAARFHPKKINNKIVQSEMEIKFDFSLSK